MYNLMIIAALLLGSCNTTPEPPVTAVEFKIQYSPETLTLEAQEGSKSIIVTSNANWTVAPIKAGVLYLLFQVIAVTQA